jgi:hypothetical protein
MMTYTTHRASARRHGQTFTVTLTQAGPTMLELVQVSTEMGTRTLSDVDYPAKSLGTASRDGYARKVLESAAYKFKVEEKI